MCLAPPVQTKPKMRLDHYVYLVSISDQIIRLLKEKSVERSELCIIKEIVERFYLVEEEGGKNG